MSQTLTPAADFNKKLARAMSEAELQKEVNNLLTANGWRWTHFRTAITTAGHYVTAISGDKGFPDVVAVRPPRLVFIELKTERGQMSEDQLEWMGNLSMVNRAGEEWTETEGAVVTGGIEVYLWKPMDLLDGSIALALSTGSQP